MSPREQIQAALAALAMIGAAASGVLAQDLSKYRAFRLGADLTTIAKQIATDPADAKVISRRPAMIQDLDWRPQPLGWSAKAETAQQVVFAFYESHLYRVTVSYDRHETEGLTASDLVEAISAEYGVAEKSGVPSKAGSGASGDEDEIVARWQDPEYRFDLMRSSYGPSYRLIGTQKSLDALAQSALADSKRLDDQEAPLREAARIAGEDVATKDKLDKARLVNKPKFRP